MRTYKVVHRTRYDFNAPVMLYDHTLRLRPREGHELRLQSSVLDIDPTASIRWHRDVEGNSVAIATFHNTTSDHLTIRSELLIQQYDIAPYDFLVADYAVDYPFNYSAEDRLLLSPYMMRITPDGDSLFSDWVDSLYKAGERIQTFALLIRINQRVYENITYQRREEEGVQLAHHTLSQCTGSCRDFANLYIELVRAMGFAARFVSGYLYADLPTEQSGATHAWAEVFIPGAGWKGFDPTTGLVVGVDHIAVAVARLPEAVPPIAGSFLGAAESRMIVDVSVAEHVEHEES